VKVVLREDSGLFRHAGLRRQPTAGDRHSSICIFMNARYAPGAFARSPLERIRIGPRDSLQSYRSRINMQVQVSGTTVHSLAEMRACVRWD